MMSRERVVLINFVWMIPETDKKIGLKSCFSVILLSLGRSGKNLCDQSNIRVLKQCYSCLHEQKEGKYIYI